MTEEDLRIELEDVLEEETSSEDSSENDDDDENADNADTINLNMELNSHIGSIMRCGAHSCQLASNKVCAKFESQISSLRQFVKNSLKLQHINIFKALGLKPKMDVPTRWCSTYDMLEDIHNNKNSYKTIEEPIFLIRNETWTFLEEFVKVFTPVKDGMQYFQISCVNLFLKNLYLQAVIINFIK